VRGRLRAGAFREGAERGAVMSKSKAKKHTEWCLRKAETELAKEGKHRGLVRTEPDSALAAKHIEKAEHNLQVFLDNRKLKHYDWTITMGFYVMYDCCLAITALFGYESRNQKCTLALIESLIEDGEIDKGYLRYLKALESDAEDDEGQILPLREKYQYSPVMEIDRQKVKELLGLCQDMIKETKGIVHS